MRKLNSIILMLLIGILVAGCGMPGPLYQTPDAKPVETPKQTIVSEQLSQES